MMEIPSHAKCVFKGIVYDVYQWQQQTFSGEIKTYEALYRPDVAVVIAVQQDAILIAKEEQAVIGEFWSHFGGFVEKDESPLQAAKREFYEESGYMADDWHLLGVYEHPGKVSSRTHIYRAGSLSHQGKAQLDCGERIELVSISWERWLTMLKAGMFRGNEEILSLLAPQPCPEQSLLLKEVLFSTP